MKVKRWSWEVIVVGFGREWYRRGNICLVLVCMAMGALVRSTIAAPTSVSLTLCCRADNDLVRVLKVSGIGFHQADNFADGARAAARNTGLLLLADDYPTSRAAVDTGTLQLCRERGLRLYVEYPDCIPGVTLGPTVPTTWERAIITSESVWKQLPPGRILGISGCHYAPVETSRAMVVIGRVAGYDRAVYGVPSSARPILFRTSDGDALVATSELSRFVSARYGPAREWRELWQGILTELAGYPIPPLKVEPAVRPAYGRADALQGDAELTALRGAAQWLLKSQLLLTRERVEDIHKLLRSGAGEADRPKDGIPGGDGSLGVLEGYASRIDHWGNQRQCIALRADCHAESAMMLAMEAAVGRNVVTSRTASNLLGYTYGPDGFCVGVRGKPEHAAYGMIAWGIVAPLWEVGNYGDDNARAILATLAAGSLLDRADWDVQMLRAVAANFRTTGRRGFRGDRIDIPELESKGWKFFRDRDNVNTSPHFEAGLWACYLWAYRQTGFEPFLRLTSDAVRTTMQAYPAGWRFKDNVERARMLLTLAWLVRVADTAEHRGWLEQVGSDLVGTMHACGAIPERLAGPVSGHYQVPATNEAFGTGESPLIQEDGDPVSDQLYTTGFALVALHEAAAATGVDKWRTAEDSLAAYLCRIQVRSESHPYLDGAWVRAFDFGRWDYWASSADAGWGPWCAEAGWGPAWIATTFGLRARNESLWDLCVRRDVRMHWEKVAAEMSLK